MKRCMKAVVAAAVLLLIMNVSVVRSAKADESILVIPPHEWSDGELYPEYVESFVSGPYEPYSAHTKCVAAARWLHTSRFAAPLYSGCLHPSEFREFRGW